MYMLYAMFLSIKKKKKRVIKNKQCSIIFSSFPYVRYRQNNYLKKGKEEMTTKKRKEKKIKKINHLKTKKGKAG